MRGLTISLLYATYHRPGGPAEVIDAWLGAANHPDSVQYVLARDSDDDAPLGQYADRVVVVENPPDPEWSTAVRNWNAAAAVADGDLLMVIADDLFPPVGWDDTLRAVCAGLDPHDRAFAVKVSDQPGERFQLMRHPVVSRRFYDDLGLFDPAFHGVYADDDITLRSFWKAVIIDGRRLVLDHRQGRLGPATGITASQRRANRAQEYRHGACEIRMIWPVWRQLSVISMVPASRIAASSPQQLASRVRILRVRGALLHLFRYPMHVRRVVAVRRGRR